MRGGVPAGLSQFPDEVLPLSRTLKSLVLSDNALASLPPAISVLTALTELLVDNNNLGNLPPELGLLAREAQVGQEMPNALLINNRSLENWIAMGTRCSGGQNVGVATAS